MPFCTECGNSYPDEGKFCPHCGEPNKLLNKTKTPVLAGSSDLRQKTDVSGGGSYGISVKDLPNGTTLENGRYTILEKLGEGGFGVVYKASDVNYDGRLKALKIIYSENYSDRLVMHKLKTEAKNMIEINHPNVVRLYDTHFEHEIKFMDMEFVDGGDLVDLMLESPNHQIPELKVWQLASQIAQGMQAIHQMHIIHQDLKPENILLTKQGVVKITDFGISETFKSSKSRIEQSDVKGTFVYASPEQLIGKNVGKESDVWSFGTTLYHVLTGETLYSGVNSHDVILQIERREFEPIPNVSDKLNALLTKCLKRNYKERFRDFGEVLECIKGKETLQTKIDTSLNKDKLKEDFIFIKAPMYGVISAYKVAVGDRVKKGDIVLILKTMKMDNDILSPYNGVIKSIPKNPGDSVGKDETLIVIYRETVSVAPRSQVTPQPQAEHVSVAEKGTIVKIPMPGMIMAYKVKVGDKVKKGDIVVILEAMKMECEIPTPAAGTVLEVPKTAGDFVDKDEVILVID